MTDIATPDTGRETAGAPDHDTIIVGGGQAGLAAGRELRRRGRDILVLDASARVGDAWRQRWDTLRVNTPAKYRLPGLRFDAPRLSFPTKDEVADYLERYATIHRIPVRLDSRVVRLTREGDRYVAYTATDRVTAANVIVATGAHRRPRIPTVAADLDPDIVTVHSSGYRNPAQLPAGGVLVVGCGNSGAEIARDVSASHETWIAGSVPGQLPMRHGPVAAAILFPLVRFAGLHVLTVDNRLGRRAERHLRHHSPPLIRTRVPDLRAAGVQMVPRLTGVDDRGRPQLSDGATPDVRSVIWCTGADEDLSFVDLPGFEDRRPVQYRGVVAGHPGLYLLGFEFLYAEGSGTLPGVGRDARYIARHLTAQAPLRVAA